MKLIIGLGNPGSRYDKTKHNIGFMTIDKLSEKLGFDFKFDKKFKGQICKTKVFSNDVIFLKPETFINLSGEAMDKVIYYYNVDPKDILVLVDDINLDLGKLRLRTKGSAGGHNGLKNIEFFLGSNEYKRIRIGVGQNTKYYDLSDYVLSKFSDDELKQLEKPIEDACDACIEFIKDKNFIDIMSMYNKNN